MSGTCLRRTQGDREEDRIRLRQQRNRYAVITFTAGKTQVTLNVSQRAQGQVGLGGITGSINGWGDGGSTEFTE